MSDLESYLQEISTKDYDMSQWLKLFQDNRVDVEILKQMTKEDLKEIGIAAFGDRFRIFTAIQQKEKSNAGETVSDSTEGSPSSKTAPNEKSKDSKKKKEKKKSPQSKKVKTKNQKCFD